MNQNDNAFWGYFAAIFVGGMILLFAASQLFASARREVLPGQPSTGGRWIVRLFESEGEPSVRLVLAPIVVVFSLVMQALARISDNQLEANYFLAGTLLGLGTAKLVGKAFAGRPGTPPAQITANKADVGVAGDATITGATVREQP